MIRPLETADAPWAARQHAALMAHSVFALFGVAFLECVYRHFAVSPHAIALVDTEGETRNAVIASTSRRSAFLRSLLRRSGFRLAWLAAAGLLHRPCRRLLRQTWRYLRTTRRGPDEAEMIFITVDPAARNRGLARRLIEATLAEYRRRGIRQVQVTVEDDNAPVKALLASLGFKEADRFVFADKVNALFVTNLAPQA
jgi:ribosomal protein S18 acetylase RimI-like enzyme